MENLKGYERLAEGMHRARADLKTTWVRTYQRSAMRLPGPIDELELGSLIDHLFGSFADVFALPADAESDSEVKLIPGSAALREVEQAAAFLGGNLASSKRSGFDVAALVLSLRDVLVPLVDESARGELARFIEWLAVVAAESFGAARVRAVHENYRDLLEDGTPLVHIVPELPCVLLVGATDVGVIDSLLSRLLLSVVRVGARAVVIDVAGVADPTTDWLLERLGRFLNHRKVSSRTEALVVGLPTEAQAAWQAVAAEMRFFEYFDAAVSEGLRVSGYRLVRTPTTGH